MTCLHAFKPHPKLGLLFCANCGDTKELGAPTQAAAQPTPPSPPPKRARRKRNDPGEDQIGLFESDSVGDAEARVARSVIERLTKKQMYEAGGDIDPEEFAQRMGDPGYAGFGGEPGSMGDPGYPGYDPNATGDNLVANTGL